MRQIIFICATAFAFFVGAVALQSDQTEAQSSSTTIEAERMTLSGAAKVSSWRSGANGGSSIYMTGVGAASDTRDYSSSITNITVTAGTYIECAGTIRMQVQVDDVVKLDKNLSNNYPWQDHSQAVNIPAGRHKVEVEYISGPSCYDELWVDKVVLASSSGGGTAPPPSSSLTTGSWTPPHAMYDMSGINSYEARTADKNSVVHDYQSWKGNGSYTYPSPSGIANIVNSGHNFMLSWEPKDWVLGRDQPSLSNQAIARGDHDAFIRRYAQYLKSAGVTFYLRFAHEMNGDWYPWSPGVNGNSPANYQAMWRHVHDIFRAEGATNVKWVFSPNCVQPQWGGATGSMASFYPGDSYVDVLGLDCYNNFSRNGMPWFSMDELLGGGSYSQITALNASKPVILAEVASVEDPNNATRKAQWIRDTATVLPQKYPRIKALVWFNQDEAGSRGPGTFRVDSSPASLDAYKQYVAGATGTSF